MPRSGQRFRGQRSVLNHVHQKRNCRARRGIRTARSSGDARCARILLALPRPEAPHFMGGQGSACGLHRAQTLRFPLFGPAVRDTASALHPAL